MERALRRAGVMFGEVCHANLAETKLADIVTGSEVIIASEGSAAAVRNLAAAHAVITYSAILSAESLATIRSYADYVIRQRDSG